LLNPAAGNQAQEDSMLQIKRGLMLVMMLTGACAMQAPPEREQTKDSELVAPEEDAGECAAQLNGCYGNCQSPSQPAECYDGCDAAFKRCIGLDTGPSR
jgi:hypothetical protein